MAARVKVAEGMRFGRLTILRKEPGYKMYCRCDCGNYSTHGIWGIGIGKIKSCGCLHRETRGTGGITHGMSHTPEFRAWASMRKRCSNPNFEDYHNYGGRGIKVCPKWDSFVAFLGDVGRRPSPKHSLDRYPDVNGNYEPDNVRWATRSEQARNMRKNILLTVDGITRCLTEWSEITGLSSGTIKARMARGMTSKEDLFAPAFHWVKHSLPRKKRAPVNA